MIKVFKTKIKMRKQDFFNELKNYKAYSKWVRNIKRIDINRYNRIIEILSKDNNWTFEAVLRFSFAFYNTNEGLMYWSTIINYNKQNISYKEALPALKASAEMWKRILLENYQLSMKVN